MKSTFFLLLCSLFLSLPTQFGSELNAQNNQETVIYLVRHAEKETTGPNKERGLVEAGEQRAEKLSQELKDAPIKAVYATEYKRTQLTAKPTARKKWKCVKEYDKNDLEGFAKQIWAKHQGETILVVGHSDTTPRLINILMGKDMKIYIEESEYDNLFKVVATKEARDLEQMKF